MRFATLGVFVLAVASPALGAAIPRGADIALNSALSGLQGRGIAKFFDFTSSLPSTTASASEQPAATTTTSQSAPLFTPLYPLIIA